VERARNVVLAERNQKIGPPHSQQQTNSTTQQRQQQTLSKQLTNHADTTRTHCRANRHFFVTAGRASEQQIGNVRAGDQKYTGNGPEKYEQCRTNVSDESGQSRLHT